MNRISSNPQITVLMSCYNAERWLDEAINSVLNQTFDDFEFILIDDGSRDNTLEIIKKYAVADSRIRIIEKENSGLPDSLNMGIAKAHGKWIARIDADDISEPERLEKQYTLAKSDPSLVLIGSNLREIDEEGTLGREYRYPTSHRDLKKNLLGNRKFFAHSSAFYKTEAVRSVGGYRPRIKISDDYDLWLRLLTLGRLASVDEPLIRLRIHEEQSSNEDGGRRQIADGRIALISYWLRQFECSDPVIAEDTEYSYFRKWAEKKLNEAGVFDYRDRMGWIKSKLNKKKYMQVFKFCVLSPGFARKYMQFLLFGEGVSRKLAEDWASIEHQKK